MASRACATLNDCCASGDRSDSKWYLLGWSEDVDADITVTCGIATFRGGSPLLERSSLKLLEFGDVSPGSERTRFIFRALFFFVNCGFVLLESSGCERVSWQRQLPLLARACLEDQ